MSWLPSQGDRAAREAAIRERERHVVVLAGAGSGKTSLLVERFLHLVIDREVSARRIAAITFTEAAAAEMRQRIRGALETELGSPAPDVATRARAALVELHRAPITTIHGLCHSLLGRHGMAAGVAPRMQVDDDDEIGRLAAERWAPALAEISRDERLARRLEHLLGSLSLKDLREVFIGLVEGPHEPASLGGGPGSGNEHLNRVLRALERCRERARKVSRDLSRAVAEAADADFAEAVSVLSEVARRARRAIAREGLVSFDALLVKTRDLLRDHEGVRRSEAARLQALLVDEFQDTDPLQYEIVFMLAQDPAKPAARDPWQVDLGPGKLFVVGDPKQSIFRFRGADIAACRRAVRRIVETDALAIELGDSYRSPREILEPLHVLFAPWLPAKDDLERELDAAPDYRPIVACRPGPDPRYGPSPRVEVWTVGGEDVPRRRRREARAIAAEIASRREGGAALRDHAILLRSFTDVAVYASALAERQIGFVMDGGRTFYRRPEVMDLLSLLRAVTEPTDPIALLAVLRSSVGAVPDAELARFGVSGQTLSLAAEPDPQELPHMARAVALLRRLADSAAALPADEAVRHLLAESGLAEIHATAFDGAQRVANLRKLLGRAIERVRSRRHALIDLAAELARGARDGGMEDEGEPALGDASLDAVWILTIHRAKGREFPVVFVADMGRKAGDDRSGPSFRLSEGAEGIALMGRDVAGRRTVSQAIAEVLDAVHAPAENRRLLYVAATRARERLILSCYQGAKGDWLEALAALGYREGQPPPDGARLLQGLVVHRRVDVDRLIEASASEPTTDLTRAARRFAEATARLAPRQPLGSPTGLRERTPGARALASSQAPSDRSLAFAIGTAVHSALERTRFEGGLVLPDAPTLASLARAAARRHGVDPEQVAERAGAILDRFSQGSIAARLARARILAAELPLCTLEPEGASCEAMRGYADIVFEEEGKVVVADWKTDLVPDDAALAAAVELYRPQVAWYAKALGRCLGRPVRGEIFFVAVDRVALA